MSWSPAGTGDDDAPPASEDLQGEVGGVSVREADVGDRGDGGPPGSIPNPAVKPVRADGTAMVTSWESRSLPTALSLFSSSPPAFFVLQN